MYKKTILDNGLRIITIPQDGTQAVTVLVLVGTGSKYETRDINGISHFLEHMYFKGTKKRPSPVMVSETLDKIGGIYNAFTAEEYTGYYAKVAFSYLDSALEWVADIFLNSLLAKEEIAKEKNVITEEINMRYDHPMLYVQVLWNQLLYGDQPAGWDVAGTKESVASITREKLAEYMENQYVASNTVVCVAGRIDDENGVIEKIKEYFSKIKTTKSLERAKVSEEQSEPNLLIYNRETDQAHLYLGNRAYNLFHPAKYAQRILAVALGGMMSSRLFVRIREKMGAAYYVAAESSEDQDTGYLAARVGVDVNRVEDVVVAILEEFKKISKEKIPAAELKKAKDYIKGKTALLLESSNALAAFYANQEILEKKILTHQQVFSRLDKVTSEDILEISSAIFKPQSLNLALIGPFQDRERFKKILRI
jgi:predicted Zn-dependent peptidase